MKWPTSMGEVERLRQGGTATALGIGPADDNDLDTITGALKLYR